MLVEIILFELIILNDFVYELVKITFINLVLLKLYLIFTTKWTIYIINK